MKRVLIAVAIAVGYAAVRAAPLLRAVAPVVTPAAAAPFPNIAMLTRQLNTEDRAALSEAYAVLGRSVAGDPAVDPVFLDTESVRRAHRAALLVVWKGVLANKAGEVDGLRDALEGAVASRIGTAEVPLNPQLKADAAKAFEDVSASLK